MARLEAHADAGIETAQDFVVFTTKRQQRLWMSDVPEPAASAPVAVRRRA